METGFKSQLLMSQAIGHKLAGNIEGAIDSNLAAIKVAAHHPGLSEDVCTMLNYLADLFTIQGDDASALASIQEAIRLARDIRSALLPSHLLMSAGILLRMGRRGQAKEEAEEALRLYRRQEHAYGVSRASEFLSRIT
jgi:tetratricopeptide (TPR) repeat protein